MIHVRICTFSREKSTAIATATQPSRCGTPSKAALSLARLCSGRPRLHRSRIWVARLSCLPGSAFSGQAFHRVAQQVSEHDLEQAQVAIAKAAVTCFDLATDVLAFDTTNFDTPIATQTSGELARRGHAKSKRSDLRVVGLGLLVSETGP